MPKKYDKAWTTTDEVAYILKIGKHTIPGRRRGHEYKRKLLHNYLESMKYRARWDGLDKEVIRATVLEELKKLGESI